MSPQASILSQEPQTGFIHSVQATRENPKPYIRTMNSGRLLSKQKETTNENLPASYVRFIAKHFKNAKLKKKFRLIWTEVNVNKVLRSIMIWTFVLKKLALIEMEMKGGKQTLGNKKMRSRKLRFEGWGGHHPGNGESSRFEARTTKRASVEFPSETKSRDRDETLKIEVERQKS